MPEINIKVRDKCAEGEGVVICNNSDYTVVWDLDEEWTPYGTKTMRVNLADGTYQDEVFTGDTATLPALTASGWVSVGLYAGDIHTSRAARLLALSSVLTPGGSPAAPAEDVYAQIMAKLNELSTVSPEDIAKAVEDYLAEHPAASASMRVEGGYIQFSGDGKTWENVIALADLKGPKGDTGDTGPQGPKGDTGPQGNPGKDGAGMDVTGATVGQIAKISAVDDNGKPTAWETIDGYTGQVTVDNLTNPDHPTDLVQYAAFQAAVPMVQQMGISGATVGQIIKVKAVNSDGCPTAWEPVDMPSGGGDETWELIFSDTKENLTEGINFLKISTDNAGNPFALKKVIVRLANRGSEDYNFPYSYFNNNFFRDNSIGGYSRSPWYAGHMFYYDSVKNFGVKLSCKMNAAMGSFDEAISFSGRSISQIGLNSPSVEPEIITQFYCGTNVGGMTDYKILIYGVRA